MEKGKNSDSTKTNGKLPPQAIEIEEAMLGALMIDKDAIHEVVGILKPESFYKPAHQEIYSAILSLCNRADAIDMLTVTQELRKMGKIEMVGGALYVMRLTDRVSSVANIETHARCLYELAGKRALIKIGTEAVHDAYEEDSDFFHILDNAESKLFHLWENNTQKKVASVNNLIPKALREIADRKEFKDGLTGIPSGFIELDRVTAGWQKGDLVVIAARPAMGKTAFALSLLRNAAVHFHHPVVMFSLEMTEMQLTHRLLSAEAEIDIEKIKRPNTTEGYEWEQLRSGAERIRSAPIFIDDTPLLSIRELRNKCRQLKAQYDVQMVVVDYLQLMETGKKEDPNNREKELSYITRQLKGLAKELDVPILVLSQLTRAVETRGGDKKPQISDLRDSGSIEESADLVLFLYRPEYYGITQDLDGNPTAGTGEVLIAKHRNGTLKDVKLRFIGRFTKFENLERDVFNFSPQQKPAGGFISSKVNPPTGNFNPSNNSKLTRSDDDPPF